MTRSAVDIAVEDAAERMFFDRYSSSWFRATGEQPFWFRFSTHPQGCSLGGKEMERLRAVARKSLIDRNVIADSQGTLGYERKGQG